MHHLIAKLKGRNGPYLKVFSDDNIFDVPPDLDNAYIYSPAYKPEDNEWFCIDDLKIQAFCPDVLKHPFNSTDYNQIQVAQYGNITHLCSVQDHLYFFQKVQAASILKRKWFSISDAPKLVQNEPIILLNKVPDAVYDSTIDRVYFKNLVAISGIFRGIDILFREATDEETRKFLRHRFISLDDDYTAEEVKTMNRKRIPDAEDIWTRLSTKQRRAMTTDIREYCPDLQYDKKTLKFTITSEDDLRLLLYGILERYYTTRRGKKRLANSVIPLKKKTR